MILLRVCRVYNTSLTWEEAGNNNNIVVHLVPHSHDDVFFTFSSNFHNFSSIFIKKLMKMMEKQVGWLKTVDQYFTGDMAEIQQANVGLILNTVTRALTDGLDIYI